MTTARWVLARLSKITKRELDELVRDGCRMKGLGLHVRPPGCCSNVENFAGVA